MTVAGALSAVTGVMAGNACIDGGMPRLPAFVFEKFML